MDRLLCILDMFAVPAFAQKAIDSPGPCGGPQCSRIATGNRQAHPIGSPHKRRSRKLAACRHHPNL